jgi:hypothetical protein
MPHVEVLPNSAASVAPGWTYVVDTGYDPSKVAINPKNKKRAAAQPGGQRGETELSARQQTAIARRIAELERDNDPKQSIAIPGKPCMYFCQSVCTNTDLFEAAPKTQNTRRIIQYQRQIKHPATTDPCTTWGCISFTKSCTVSPAPERVRVNSPYTCRSNPRSFNTACAISCASRFRRSRRCAPFY